MSKNRASLELSIPTHWSGEEGCRGLKVGLGSKGTSPDQSALSATAKWGKRDLRPWVLFLNLD